MIGYTTSVFHPAPATPEFGWFGLKLVRYWIWTYFKWASMIAKSYAV